MPLTIIHARAIGLMTMIDAGKQDHKIIAVATEDPEFNSYREASEMPPHRLLMLRRFFQDYKQLEGKAVEVDEIVRRLKRIPSFSTRCTVTASSAAKASRQRNLEEPRLRSRVNGGRQPLNSAMDSGPSAHRGRAAL